MSSKPVQTSSYLFWLVCVIYFFTGLSALAYEVLWARILSTLFGVSIFGVVVTVSAFLAGLGAGSIAGRASLKLIKNPLRVFAILEILVALFAFNLPSILAILDETLVSYSITSFSSWTAIQGLATFVLMFIPAFALGFGFPMILSTLRKSSINIGTIYALNTLGGVAGALIPLVLLPIAGWTVSVRLVAIFALLLAISALIISFLLKSSDSQNETSENATNKVSLNLLLAYALIGAAAIMLQIAWTRLYGMFLLRTEYVMAVILATFLIGIGFGSLIASRVKQTFWILVLPLSVAISALVSLYALPYISEWAETVDYASLGEAMITQGVVVAVITLPATLAFGAWFPLLVSGHSNKDHSGSLLYGFNSVGAALGGLAAGFIILPLLGTSALIVVATLIVLIVSFYWLKQIYYKVGVVVVALAMLPVLSLPDISQLLPDSQQNSKNLFFFEDAMSLTHVVEKEDGERLLLADLQRMDASSEPTAVRVQKNQSRLPLLLHPNPKDVLFLGLGTGITAAGSLPIENLQRTSVELSKGAIWAAESYFKEVNGDIFNKATVIRDDARRFLKVGDKTYDVIVGDLFHPDLVGRSELLSTQQFKRAKRRLSEDGIFVQWLALNQFDLETMKVVLATFKSAFPDAILFIDGFRLAMVGVNGEFHGINSFKNNLHKLTPDSRSELTGGEGLWSWVGRYLGPISNVSMDKIQDEWAPVIEFQLPKTKFNRQNHLFTLLRHLLASRHSLEEALEVLRLTGDEKDYFAQAYMANNLYYQSWMAYFSNKQMESQRLLSTAYANNPDDQWIGFGMADAMFASIEQAKEQGIDRQEALRKILDIRPDHLLALKALREMYINASNIQGADQIALKISALSPLSKLK